MYILTVTSKRQKLLPVDFGVLQVQCALTVTLQYEWKHWILHKVIERAAGDLV